jgi:predicted metal-dependent hydrolase
MNQQRFVFEDGNPPEGGSREYAHQHTPFAFVRHPRARRYVVRVKPDGTVCVTIPRRGSRREAAAFAEAQRDWIERQLRRLERERASRPPDPPPELVRAGRSRALRELPPRLRELAAQFGLAVSRISIRNQRARWGSCSRNGHICLNWRLVTMPAWVRDYVLIHELMHLKRMDHSPKFWKLVEAACPDWRGARRWLRDYERGW